ncbi:hypothetical protein [Paracidovorax oryzae]|uniref:hypothetical protein n=1 Tax=Paracidovorax oryzae TaxID=862720 RepID=UPI00037A154D|nr:hypothetical protein [Paracidovorax oryzae]
MDTSSRPKRYATISSEIEAHSQARRHPAEEAAIARFACLPVAAQMQLAREIVTTRAAELCLAYRNLIMVTAGLRSRLGRNGRQEVHDETCILLVVKRKWRSSIPEARGQMLPRHLLTFGDVDGQRVLLAIPTDVQPARWFAGAVARGASAINVEDPKHRALGTMTCGVRLYGTKSPDVMALSALHVLSPFPVINEIAPGAGSSTRSIGAGAKIGTSSRWGGVLVRNGVSFDAQLATVTDIKWRPMAFAGLSLSAARPYVADRAMFDTMTTTRRFQILAPSNHPEHLDSPRSPMIAQFVAYIHDELPIDYRARTPAGIATVGIRHRELLKLRVMQDCPPPEDGDSGSAVVTWWPDGSMTLVGMFIASPDDETMARVAYVLPAWQLFNLDNWDALPHGTTRMVPTF